jgi:hypothetical protein
MLRITKQKTCKTDTARARAWCLLMHLQGLSGPHIQKHCLFKSRIIYVSVGGITFVSHRDWSDLAILVHRTEWLICYKWTCIRRGYIWVLLYCTYKHCETGSSSLMKWTVILSRNPRFIAVYKNSPLVPLLKFMNGFHISICYLLKVRLIFSSRVCLVCQVVSLLSGFPIKIFTRWLFLPCVLYDSPICSFLIWST